MTPPPHPCLPCVDGWYKNSAVNILNLLKSTLIDGSIIQWPAAITVIVSFQPMKTSVLCKVGGPQRFPSWTTPFVKCNSASTDGFLRGQLVPRTVTGWRHRWAVRVNNGSLLCFKTNDKDSTWPTSGEFLHIWILPFLSWDWGHLWLDLINSVPSCTSAILLGKYHGTYLPQFCDWRF